MKQTFQPYTYVNSCIIGCNLNINDFDVGMKKFIWVSNTSPADQPDIYLKEIEAAPVGSVLKRPIGIPLEVGANAGIAGNVQTHIVKTEVVEFLLVWMNEAIEVRDRNPTKMVHGNSGLGKTQALHVVAYVASMKQHLVLHLHGKTYKTIWDDEVDNGGVDKHLLLAIWESNPLSVLKHFLGVDKAFDPEAEFAGDADVSSEFLLHAMQRLSKYTNLVQKERKKLLKHVEFDSLNVFCTHILGRLFEKLKDACRNDKNKQILVIMDDVNTLVKGTMKVDHNKERYREDELARRIQIGARLQDYVNVADTKHALHCGEPGSLIAIVAASQHFQFIAGFGACANAHRLWPPNQVWDIVGFFYYFYASMASLNWEPRTAVSLLKSIFRECGMLPRHMVFTINSAHDQVKKRSADTDKKRRGILNIYMTKLKEKVKTGLTLQYHEVFRNFYLEEFLPDQLGTLKVEDEVLNSQHEKFVTKVLEYFQETVLEIVDDTNAFFDTGLLIQAPTGARYGFISRIAMQQFAFVVAKNRSAPFTYIKGTEENHVFERAVANAIKLAGLDMSGLTTYRRGAAPVAPSVPAPVATVGVNCRSYGGRYIIDFADSSDRDFNSFRNFMDDSSAITTSLLVISERLNTMPAFDQLLLCKEVTDTREATYINALQCSVEENWKTEIKEECFANFETTGLKVINGLLRLMYPSENYYAVVETGKGSKIKSYVVKEKKSTGSGGTKKQTIESNAEGIVVTVFYVCMRDLSTDKRDGFEVVTIPEKSTEAQFRVGWAPSALNK